MEVAAEFFDLVFAQFGFVVVGGVEGRRCLKLLGAEGFDRVHGGGSARGEIAGEVSGGDQSNRDGSISQRIDGIDVEQDRRHEAHDDDGEYETESGADAGENESVSNE